MSELLGLSFDGPASPEISFGERRESISRSTSGWGVGWYPIDELGALILRNPQAVNSVGLRELLQDWDRIRTQLVVAHIRGSAAQTRFRDTHPFERIFGGRSWVLAHAGELGGELDGALPLPDHPQYRSIGSTDTEHLFSWLLSQAEQHGAGSLSELGYQRLGNLLTRANQLGSLNIVLADGEDLVVYQDANLSEQLFWSRRIPPHETDLLSRNEVTINLSDPFDTHRTVLVVSSVKFEDEGWTPMSPGQLLVVRRGSVVWDSVAVTGIPSDADTKSVQAPVEAAPDSNVGPRLVTSAPSLDMPMTALRRPPRRTLDVYHRTTYTYEEPVENSSHRYRLSPVHDAMQRVLSHELSIKADGTRFVYEDVFGNDVTGFDVIAPFTELVVEAKSRVEVKAFFDRPDLLPDPNTLPLVWMPWQRQMMSPYLLPPELPENQLRELSVFAESFVARSRQDLLATLDDLTATIYRDFRYESGFTTLETTPYEVYRNRAGVCQDFANLMICVCRLLNVPARYRVGYIYTAADYENTVQSEASHAWVEVYVPHLGWRGYDPTNGCRVGSDHVRVACGRNYRDATPTSGVIHRGGSGTEKLDIEVRVEIVPADDAE